MANIKDLSPNPRNPRKAEKNKLEMLAKSMIEHGPLHGFVYNIRSKQLIGGHQTQKVMPADARIFIEKRYEKTTPQGTVATGYVDYLGERWPYREVDFDEQKEKAAVIAANKGAGEWDFPKLQEFVLELDASNFDLDLTMFDESELKDMFGKEFGSDPDKDKIEDEVPEVPKTPYSKLGDLYELGEHRLLCGDSTDKTTVERLMNGEKADMVFTDPPYGIDVVQSNSVGGAAPTKFGTDGAGKIVPAKTYRKIAGDETTDVAEKFYELCKELNFKNIVLFGGNYFTDFLPPSRCWFVWDKEMTGNFSQAEMAWTNFEVGGVRVFKFLWNGLSREGNRKDELKGRVHPTQKPVGLFEQVFNRLEKNKSVFDGFGGSGSTLIACEKTKRKCFMMELDPHYIDVIVSRWVKYTGIQDIKRNGEPMTWTNT